MQRSEEHGWNPADKPNKRKGEKRKKGEEKRENPTKNIDIKGNPISINLKISGIPRI